MIMTRTPLLSLMRSNDLVRAKVLVRATVLMRVTALVALLLGALAAADLADIPADHRWVAQINVQAIAKGGLGEALRIRLSADEVGRKLAMLEGLTGFQPLRDLDRVTITGQGPEEERACAILRGRFDTARVTALVAILPGHAQENHRAHVIHRWNEVKDGKARFGVVAADRIVVARTADRVKAVLDVVDGQAKAIEASVLPALDPTALIVGAARDLDYWRGMKAGALVFKRMQSLGCSVVERDGALRLHLVGDATNEAAAKDLVDLGNGLLAFARLKPGKGPAKEIQNALVANAKITRNRAQITAASQFPVELVLKRLGDGSFLHGLKAVMQAAAAARTAAEAEEPAVEPAVAPAPNDSTHDAVKKPGNP